MNYIQRKKRQFQESAWLLGICENGFDDLKENRIHWISNGKYEGKKWFADPFILDYDEKKIFLLVEEFDYKVHRGRIAKLTVDRARWIVEDCKIILDLPTHLSFPMIWRENESVYVCPENYFSGFFNLYEYDSDFDSLVFIKPLVDEKLTDATLYHDETGYYILSTYDPTPNGKVLTIYNSDNFSGGYQQIQRIVFKENVARNAGMIFKYGGELVRPAQECNMSYGHAISFQKVEINKGEFSFEEIYRKESVHTKYKIGTHTFNQHPQGMAVIDVKGYSYPICGRILRHLDTFLEVTRIKKLYRPV